jgi:hypothetical protein
MNKMYKQIVDTAISSFIKAAMLSASYLVGGDAGIPAADWEEARKIAAAAAAAPVLGDPVKDALNGLRYAFFNLVDALNGQKIQGDQIAVGNGYVVVEGEEGYGLFFGPYENEPDLFSVLMIASGQSPRYVVVPSEKIAVATGRCLPKRMIAG